MFDLLSMKNAHKGETCVIIGNGPSLKNVPRKLLDSFPTFGANKLFLLQDIPEFKDFVPTYYTVIDMEMLHDCTTALMDGYKPEHVFVPWGIPVPGGEQIRFKVSREFSFDPTKFVVMGGTVTFANMQLAYWMGFKEAFLVGMDHRYTKYNGKPQSAFIAQGKDEDHFHPDYFRDGHLYNTWTREGMDAAYLIAKRTWERDGRRIVNLTPDSALDIFPKAKIEDVLKVLE
jgi:hypothetical protein